MRTVLVTLSLAACSDYNFKEKEEPALPGEDTAAPLPPGSPEVVVDPLAIDRGTLCGSAPAEPFSVTLSNEGDADLTISALDLVGEGWALDAFTLPIVIVPGDSQAIGLVSEGGGEATLRITTDDADEGLIELPLRTEVDLPPTVSLLTPTSGEILPGSTATTFTAQVSDDLDPVESLVVQWASDKDGLLGSGSPDASGLATFAWDAAARSAGSHLISVDLVDSCGQPAHTEAAICQDEGYTADSLDLTTWHFEGSARYDSANGFVELTQALPTQAGTAFQTGAAVGADNITIDFSFYVSGGSGADGISLTALDTTRMSGFVGESGGGIGYMGLPGWSIEVDTWYNPESGDPTAEDHLSFHFDGSLYSPSAWAALPDMEDGSWHTMSVSVLAPRVTISIDGVGYIDQDITGTFNFPAYVGFTAATGAATNFHLIDALEVTKYVCTDG